MHSLFSGGRCILSSAAGVILFSARAGHSFICSRSILFSARAGHSLVSGTGVSAEQTAAAVGRQNACPSGAVLQPFRGRRQFEYAVRHTFPAKSRPLEAILYIHRPRSRKYLGFVSGNVPPSLYEISAQQRQISRQRRRCILFSAGPGHSFICGGSHSLFSVAGAFFHLRRESFSFQRGRCILSSAVPEYLLSRQLRPLEGKTHVHRARYCSHFAAVGSLSMPSATLSRQNRGRWKPFYMSTGRAHENTSSSPPELPCLRFTKMPRLRLRKYLASASRTASSSSPGMPCLRFTNCLVFASGNASPSLYEMLALQRQISCVSGGGAFLSSAAKSFSRQRGQCILSSAVRSIC